MICLCGYTMTDFYEEKKITHSYLRIPYILMNKQNYIEYWYM